MRREPRPDRLLQSGRAEQLDRPGRRFLPRRRRGDLQRSQKVKFTPLSAKERFTALQSGEIDMLSRNTTWTMSRDTSLGLKFAGVMYYDGQGFMVKKSLGVNSALDLNGASVCTQTGTTTELNLADYFRANNMTYQVVAFEKNEEVLKAYEDGRCDVLHHRPVGPLCRAPQAGEAGRSCRPARDHLQGAAGSGGAPGRRCLVQCREVDLLRAAQCRRARRHPGQCRRDEELAPIPRSSAFLASRTEGDFGVGIGLTNDWAVQIVKHVGNYGEIFERNVGENTPLKIARGKNALWSKGGLQYAPPIR